jgi:hypothetical protein
LVNVILKSANAEKSGMIDRVQIKEAIIANLAKINSITEESLPQTNPVVSQVMKMLDESSSGVI